MSNTSDQDRLDAISTANIMLRNFHIHKDSTEDRALAIAKMIGKEVKEQILEKYYTGATMEPNKVDAGPAAPDAQAVVSDEASNSGAPYSHVSLQINLHPSSKIFGANYHHTGGTININTDGSPESIAQAALAVGKILGPWPEEG